MVTDPRPPGPRGPASWARLLRARRDPIGFLTDLRDRYGDVTYVRAGPLRVFVVSHPEHAVDLLDRRAGDYVKGDAERRGARRLLGEGLLASEGDLHARQRRILEPLMASRAVARFAGEVVASGRRAAERWWDGQAVDVEEEMNALTHAIVIRALFGVDVDDPAAGPLPRALREATEAYSRLPVPFSTFVGRLPLPANRRFARARARLDAVVRDMIAGRRAAAAGRRTDDVGPPARGDLLADLVAAGVHGEAMGDRQVRDEALTLFLPGRKPLAAALTWAWYLLSRNPGPERTLHEELDRVLGDRDPTAQDLPRLEYTRMVMSEALRLYPPAWVVLRKAARAHRIGPYPVRKGASVMASHYVIHHDPRFHEDPESFDPERFRDPAAAEAAFSWFPFGAGNRRCIGEPFAWMEGPLLMATIARRWSLRHDPGHRVELLPKVTLLPRHGMRMVAHRRASDG